MSVEFEKVRIGDLGKVVTGKTPPTSREEYFGADYPFITPTDIDGSKRHVETERYLSQESKKDFSNYLLPSGAICFVCIGATIGKICMTNVPSFTNQQINSIIVDGNRYDNCFIYYLLSTKKEHIKNIAGGAATPIVNKSAFSDVFVEIPELIVQKKIAALLSTYDDLIENNLRRIKILEEMAQILYREWFVKFRFPGHQKGKMVNSPLGNIPEGWKVGNVGDLVEERKERNRGINSSPVLTVKNTKKFMRSEEYFSKRVYSKSLKNYKEVRRGDFAYNPSRINIGSIAFQEDYEIGVVSPMYVVFSAKVELVGGHFLWMLLQQEEIYRQIVQLCSGTVRQVFKFRDFSLVKTVIPSKKVQSMFEEIVAPIQSQTKTLAVIVENLRQTRDLLLPKLISGELDVSELDITIPEANA